MTTLLILVSFVFCVLSFIGWIWNINENRFNRWFTCLSGIISFICLVLFLYGIEQFHSKGRYYEEQLLNKGNVILGYEPTTHSLPLIKKTIVIEDGADVNYWIIADSTYSKSEK